MGEQDGRFAAEERGRLIRWLLQELAETTGGIARSYPELVAACDELGRAVDSWLADAEQRTGTEGPAAT